MTWDGVPWAVGASGTATEGARIPVEALRLVSYLAADGHEGIVSAGDAAVLPLAVPGGGVRVMPGGLSVLNRAADPLTGGQQAYVLRNPAAETVTINPTGAGAGRTDLVAVVVEDAQYAGQPAPADPVTGPYTRTRVYEGVAAGTKTLADVDPGQTGYALALVTLPASTGTVEAAHITDLRGMARGRESTWQELVNLPTGSDKDLVGGSFVTFPEQATWDVQVPSWASRVKIVIHITGMRVRGGAGPTEYWNGQLRVGFGALSGAVSELNPTVPQSGKDSFPSMAATNLKVPNDYRGTTQNVRLEGRRLNRSGGVEVFEGYGLVVVASARFIEEPDADVWV